MIIILFFLTQLPVVADTVNPAADIPDSLITDSLTVDTLPKYTIPEVLEIADPGPPEPGSIAAVTINDYDLFLSDAFAVSPFLVKAGLLYRRGSEPYRIPVTLNSHPITNQLTGFFNIDRLGAQFIDRITVNGDNVDLHTLINRYNRPYSYIRFMVLGKTTLYNINFTRPITNDMGFYTAGTYRRSLVSDDTGFAYETANSFYANYYWNNFFKSRVDFVYNGSAIGEKQKTELIDASLILGRGAITTNIFFNYNHFDFDSSAVRADDAAYGAILSGLHDLNFLRLGWHCTIKGDDARIQVLPWPPNTDQFEYFIQGGITAAKEWGRFQGILTADLDFVGRDGFYPAPDLKISYNPFDSLFFFVDVSRTYRIPTIIDRSFFHYDWDPYFPNFPTVGNPNLLPEISWRQEAGYRYKGWLVTFYKIDYQNYIKYRDLPDRGPFNIPKTDFIGVENALELPLTWGFAAGIAGNYLIHAHTYRYYPKYNAEFSLSWQAEKGRARFKIFGRGRYLGPRFESDNADLRPVFSAEALVRFVTLTAVLRVDNILDDEVYDFPVSERDISLSVKWEFFD